jgi:S-adenosylmethionine synthetase
MLKRTCEYVGAGHPDKVADQIADSILDTCLEEDPRSRVACEVLVKNNVVVLAGEITTNATLHLKNTVKKTLEQIGYYYEPTIINLLSGQSTEISSAVGEDLGAGDQGCSWGHACDETSVYMPLSLVISRELSKMLKVSRERYSREPFLKIPFSLLPDCKTQVTICYDKENKPQFIDRVVISTNHKPGLLIEELRDGIKDMIRTWFGVTGNCHGLYKYFTKDTVYDINPAGLWTFGGPEADCGATNRKIVVDHYGPDYPVGGGGLSGKDSSKQDRSGAYAARYIAKNIVASGYADKASVQLAYIIGKSDPASVCINTNRGWKIDRDLEKAVSSKISLKPKDIITKFQLRNPIFFETSHTGHFGFEPFCRKDKMFYSWEEINLF